MYTRKIIFQKGRGNETKVGGKWKKNERLLSVGEDFVKVL